MDTARRACERALARAADAGPTMITVTAQRARCEAQDSDERRRRGAVRSPLDGVPVVWKDLFDVEGTVTTAGSALWCDRPAAARDSALVARLRDLGLVTIGKANLSEFAFSGLGVNRRFGTPVNPVDPARVPGGSSSGSAVAVASGLVPIAIGTDTSGSVRVPAAYTGCVGYRASRHRYGPHDFHALSPTLDSVGVLARTLADIRLLDRSLTGAGDGVPAGRLVAPAGEWLDDCTPGVRAAFDAAVRELGAEVRRFESMESAQRLFDEHGTIVGAEAYTAFGALSGVEPATRRRLIRNATVDAAPLRRAMAPLRRRFEAELGDAVLVCPTVRHEPPRIADLATDAAYDAANASTLRTTMVLSYLGACGVSLPVAGAGLLLSAPAGRDGALLATAERIEPALRR